MAGSLLIIWPAQPRLSSTRSTGNAGKHARHYYVRATLLLREPPGYLGDDRIHDKIVKFPFGLFVFGFLLNRPAQEGYTQFPQAPQPGVGGMIYLIGNEMWPACKIEEQ